MSGATVWPGDTFLRSPPLKADFLAFCHGLTSLCGLLTVLLCILEGIELSTGNITVYCGCSIEHRCRWNGTIFWEWNYVCTVPVVTGNETVYVLWLFCTDGMYRGCCVQVEWNYLLHRAFSSPFRHLLSHWLKYQPFPTTSITRQICHLFFGFS